MKRNSSLFHRLLQPCAAGGSCAFALTELGKAVICEGLRWLKRMGATMATSVLDLSCRGCTVVWTSFNTRYSSYRPLLRVDLKRLCRCATHLADTDV